MARINIEDAWWSSSRRMKLVRLFKGDSRLADGLAVQAWRMAQQFVKQNYLIPMSQFSCLEDYQLLFDCDLAILCTENAQVIEGTSKHRLEIIQAGSSEYLAYVKGSREHHEWLVKNRKNASVGGKKSSLRPRDKKGRLLKQSPDTQAMLGVLPSASNGIQVSSSSSISSSISNKESIGTLSAIPIVKESFPEVGKFIGAYVKAYQNRYGEKVRPDLGGNIQGQIKMFLKDLPVDRACNLIQVYLQMDTPWFKTKCHDFITFKNNLNPIGNALDTGVQLQGDKINWEKIEQDLKITK